jgi:hypothetical protein
MKNNINILVLFGLVLMCFGLCCLAVFIQDLLEASQYNAVFRWRAPQVFFPGHRSDEPHGWAGADAAPKMGRSLLYTPPDPGSGCLDVFLTQRISKVRRRGDG